MPIPPINSDGVARALLKQLKAAREATVGEPHGYAIDAIQTLGRLHARTTDGRLPGIIDGQDFLEMAARLFDDVRKPVRIAVSILAGRVDDARSHEMDIALDRRTALQYLKDDFQGTVAEGLVDDDLFEEEDGYLAEKLREYGPFDFAAPPNVPDSHWWWPLSVGREPASEVDYPNESHR